MANDQLLVAVGYCSSENILLSAVGKFKLLAKGLYGVGEVAYSDVCFLQSI